MKRINNNDLDVYLYIKDYIKENKYSPSYREIVDNTNYNNIASVKYSVEKLEKLKFVRIKRSERKFQLKRAIKVIENDYTKNKIKELRDIIGERNEEKTIRFN